MESMTIQANLPSEPVWCLDRRNSGHLFWRRESSRVKFRCDVEVLEFTKDPHEDQPVITDSVVPRRRDPAGLLANLLVVCATCLAAIVVVALPWLLIGPA